MGEAFITRRDSNAVYKDVIVRNNPDVTDQESYTLDGVKYGNIHFAWKNLDFKNNDYALKYSFHVRNTYYNIAEYYEYRDGILVTHVQYSSDLQTNDCRVILIDTEAGTIDIYVRYSDSTCFQNMLITMVK